MSRYPRLLKFSDLRITRCLIWWDIADDNYRKLMLESCIAQAAMHGPWYLPLAEGGLLDAWRAPTLQAAGGFWVSDRDFGF